MSPHFDIIWFYRSGYRKTKHQTRSANLARLSCNPETCSKRSVATLWLWPSGRAHCDPARTATMARLWFIAWTCTKDVLGAWDGGLVLWHREGKSESCGFVRQMTIDLHVPLDRCQYWPSKIPLRAQPACDATSCILTQRFHSCADASHSSRTWCRRCFSSSSSMSDRRRTTHARARVRVCV